MRFLFTTLQSQESAFYGHVDAALRRLGHQSAHVVVSRAAAARLRRHGARAYCLPELATRLGPLDVEAAAAEIEAAYPVPSLRDTWVHDDAYMAAGGPERAFLERSVRAFRVTERIFDEYRPEVVVPGVGRDIVRTAPQLVAYGRGVPVLFAFHSLFPRGLRIVTDDFMAPLVDPALVKPLGAAERAEVEAFIAAYMERAKPMLPHRRPRLSGPKLADFAGLTLRALLVDHDNEYVRPGTIVRNYVVERVRPRLAQRLYRALDPDRPFVYFPRQASTDFKMERQAPHCVDQEYLFAQVADALPQGYDLVVKEHPVSVGRNSLTTLRRIATMRPNVRLIDPFTNAHELMRRASAVVVINSNTGFESLFYGTPVLTLGQPVYAGYGLTVDVSSFRELRDAVPAALRFRPDRERLLEVAHAAMQQTYEGVPNWVDNGRENAGRMARALDAYLGDSGAAAPPERPSLAVA